MLFLFPFFLIVYEFCTNMSNDMYLPALGLIGYEFSAPINLVQMTIAAWLAGDTAVQLLIGPMADRYGRRAVIFGGGILFLASTLGCALATSLLFLIIARFVQGIGVCTMMVAGYASIHDVYDDRKVIKMLAWMGSAAIIAPAVGPVLGGLVLLFASWRTIFLILFLLSALALVGLFFVMPKSAASRHPLNLKNILRCYRKIFSNTTFMTSATSFALLYGGVIAWITASPYLLMEHLDLSPTEFGYLQFPIFGAYIIGAQGVKLLLEKFQKERFITFGLSLAVLSGLALLAFSFFAPYNVLSFILPMVAYSVGFGAASASLNRTTLNETDEQKGAAIAVFYLTMTGAGTLVSLALSIFPEKVYMAGVVIAISILLAFFLNNLRRRLDKRS